MNENFEPNTNCVFIHSIFHCPNPGHPLSWSSYPCSQTSAMLVYTSLCISLVVGLGAEHTNTRTHSFPLLMSACSWLINSFTRSKVQLARHSVCLKKSRGASIFYQHLNLLQSRLPLEFNLLQLRIELNVSCARVRPLKAPPNRTTIVIIQSKKD